MENPAPKVLVAGVGNILHCDDGFGIEVARRLMAHPQVPGMATVIETGIGGMALIQEAMRGYDALLVVDACTRGGTPGQLYFLDAEVTSLQHLDLHQQRDYFADTHYATPDRALHMLAGLGRLPAIVRILGCEPTDTHTLGIGLSAAVQAATETAVSIAYDWLCGMQPDSARRTHAAVTGLHSLC